MTLAEQCEAIWPCGWQEKNPTHGYAPVAGHQVEVLSKAPGFSVYAASTWHNSDTLRGALVSARAHLAGLPPVPDIIEMPVQQQAEEILLEQGWERNPAGWYTKCAFFKVGVNPTDCTLWLRNAGSTRPFKTVPLSQGKVREQLRELLTFPAWKEP